MKRISLFILFITITIAGSSQQKLRLNGYANYVFDDSYDSYYDATVRSREGSRGVLVLNI